MQTRRWIILGAALLAGCATSAGPLPVLQAFVEARDSSSFLRQADGSWVELSNDGLARFRFTDEGARDGALIMFDETRHVRLRLDPLAMTLTEETPNGWRPLYSFTRITRGAATPSEGALQRVWFEGGGAFVRQGETWRELSSVDGFPAPAEWREEAHDAHSLTLSADGRSATIDFSAGEVTFEAENAASVTKKIRAVDR